jgi:hypothetical protein
MPNSGRTKGRSRGMFPERARMPCEGGGLRIEGIQHKGPKKRKRPKSCDLGLVLGCLFDQRRLGPSAI